MAGDKREPPPGLAIGSNGRSWSVLAVAVGVLLAGVLLAAALAPYVYAEWISRAQPQALADAASARLAKGRMFDDYFAVQALGAGTYAIGEPRYYQQNYAYLIVGTRRALLFDAGSGTRDISKVVHSLTRLPVTVMVSHLHFDHLGGIGAFDGVAMIDLPQTRADVADGRFRPGRYEFLGFLDGQAAPTTRVTQWLAPGAVIDLGGRTLTVLSTPGHTPSSAALFDAGSHRLFIGDFIYPTTLYAFLPGASLSAYHRTAQRLLAELPADTILWTAHCCRKGEGIAAPWLDMADVRDLDRTLLRVQAGTAVSHGFYPRVYPVNDQMTLATGFVWNNR
jgi:glyoxylase-like metal-dependent hydrolase (beta-lactamase superfamily II)